MTLKYKSPFAILYPLNHYSVAISSILYIEGLALTLWPIFYRLLLIIRVESTEIERYPKLLTDAKIKVNWLSLREEVQSGSYLDDEDGHKSLFLKRKIFLYWCSF